MARLAPVFEFYPQIKTLHVSTVLLSGALFATRGIAVQRAAGWAMAPSIRWLSYTIDSILLASALVLTFMLPSAVFANNWLTVKIAILLVYIGFGTLALKRGRTLRQKFLFFIGAILMYISMLAIASSHDPLGPLRIWQ